MAAGTSPQQAIHSGGRHFERVGSAQSFFHVQHIANPAADPFAIFHADAFFPVDVQRQLRMLAPREVLHTPDLAVLQRYNGGEQGLQFGFFSVQFVL